MIEDNKRTYEELLEIEGKEDHGVWRAFERGEVSFVEVNDFTQESRQRGDHNNAVFYNERLAEHFEKEGFHGIANSFKATAANAKKARDAYVRQLKEPGQMV